MTRDSGLLTTPASQEKRALREFITMRWIAITAQLFVVLFVHWFWQGNFPLVVLLSIFAGQFLTNQFLHQRSFPQPGNAIGIILLFDVFCLTAVLALTGGASNPFSILYLSLVMLSAAMCSRLWLWLVVVTSSIGFGILFFVGRPLPHHLGGHTMEHGTFSAHLQGMWLAYTLLATITAVFGSRVAAALQTEREQRFQTARLLGLATLAAGAAHEVGNPLATIRMAASELEEELTQRNADPEVIADLQLINREVMRASTVLTRMSEGAGELEKEDLQWHDLQSIAQSCVERQSHPIALSIEDQLRVKWPVHATKQILEQLLKNAVQANPKGKVKLHAQKNDQHVVIEISDQGPGIATEVLDRLGDPFFTTKPDGTGLGMFVAKSLVQHMGGRTEIVSNSGQGTIVRLLIPEVAA